MPPRLTHITRLKATLFFRKRIEETTDDLLYVCFRASSCLENSLRYLERAIRALIATVWPKLPIDSCTSTCPPSTLRRKDVNDSVY